MSEKIYIFTMVGCPHCSSLKKRLKEIQIPFVDVDIDENNKLWDDVVSQIGYDYVPTIYITQEGDGDGDVYVPSVDYEDEDEIVNILTNKFKTKGN